MRNLTKILATLFLAGSLAGCVGYGGGYGHSGYGYGGNQHYDGDWQHQGNGQVLSWQDRQQNNLHRQ